MFRALTTQSQHPLALAWVPLLRQLVPSSAAGNAAAGIHSSSVAGSGDTGGSGSTASPDVFTASLAAKTEEELRQMVLKQGHSAAAAVGEAGGQAAVAGAGEGEQPAAEEQAPHGRQEIGGFAGRPEPTRFNDWEIKGRCSDF